MERLLRVIEGDYDAEEDYRDAVALLLTYPQ
jgi:hypothetical protein